MWLTWLALLTCAALLLLGCDRAPDGAPHTRAQSQAPTSQSAGGNAAFTVLAGSELKDVEPALMQAAQAAGVALRISYAGTLDMVERVNAGERFDALLPPNGAYPVLALHTAPAAREKLFYSRVALGVKTPVAQQLGWRADAPPTWAAIAKAAAAGQLRYGMTNPSSSNTGMSALFAVASAAAGKTEDLSEHEIKADVLKDFLKGQQLTAGSSGWLAEAFERDPSAVNALVNYEAVILRLNEKLPAAERLTLIYPQDGVITADYPLLLLNPARRDEYDALVAQIKAPAFQGAPLQQAFLRPANPEAAPNPALPSAAVAELSFPNRLEVIDTVLMAYQADLRRPATSIFVLDVSGSMHGQRLADMQRALRLLSGAEGGAASQRYAAFQARERVALIRFSGDVSAPEYIAFAPGTLAQDRQRVIAYTGQLQANGATAIYDALAQAHQVAAEELKRDANRFISIVLLTDGENNRGRSLREFSAERQQWEQAHGPHAASVRVFPIIFGEADARDMQAVATLTGGRAFDARKSSLAQVFKEIRGYQ